MKISLGSLIILSALALPAFAGQGGQMTNEFDLSTNHTVNAQFVEPYSQYIDSESLSSAAQDDPFSLQLKPLKANVLSELQFKTQNNRGVGAGYTSPYLWEVGRGPGYQNPSQRFFRR